jgi:hypothetical protein
MTIQYSNIQNVLEQVAAIQMTIACNGLTIRQALPYQQWLQAPANTPFFANWVTGGPTKFVAQGLQSAESTIHMALCTQPIAAGGSLAANQEGTLMWRDPVFVAFADKLRLGGSLSWVKESLIVDWDITRLTFTDKLSYHALTFSLKVYEAFPLTIGV